MREARFLSLEKRRRVTVLVPAYNEADVVARTVRSLQAQTHPPTEIIVIDDCSTDATARTARGTGARVLRPPRHTGSKAGAQNLALPLVRTEFVMAVHPDTTLAPSAIENLLASFELPQVAAACGFMLPRHVRTAEERGRYVEYLFASAFYRQVHDGYHRHLIESGCCSIFRTVVLQRRGGWPASAFAGDMDLTWQLYQSGYGVRFMPSAASDPSEPPTYILMRRQLRRRSPGILPLVHGKGR